MVPALTIISNVGVCCERALHQMWLILIFRANVRLDGFLGSSHNRVVTVAMRRTRGWST